MAFLRTMQTNDVLDGGTSGGGGEEVTTMHYWLMTDETKKGITGTDKVCFFKTQTGERPTRRGERKVPVPSGRMAATAGAEKDGSTEGSPGRLIWGGSAAGQERETPRWPQTSLNGTGARKGKGREQERKRLFTGLTLL